MNTGNDSVACTGPSETKSLMEPNESDAITRLFLSDLPSRGTLTALVEGSVLPKPPKEDTPNRHNFRGCWRFECSADPPLITELKRARRKQVAKTLGKSLGHETGSTASRKRFHLTSPSFQNKRAKQTAIQRTLLSVCGSEMVTEDAAQTERKLKLRLKSHLLEICAELELPTGGTKQDLVHRLMHRYHRDRRDGCFVRGASSSLDE